MGAKLTKIAVMATFAALENQYSLRVLGGAEGLRKKPHPVRDAVFEKEFQQD